MAVFYCMHKKTTHWLMLAGIAVLAGALMLLSLHEPEAVSAATYEWGLSFQTEGQPPVPNLSAQELAAYDAFYCLGGTEKRLYLTFDAGYDNGNTGPILDALKKHGAQGAFFVVGTYVTTYPDIVKRMVDEGHIVGNHTYHHPNMSQKGRAEFEKELIDLETVFLQTTGVPMQRFYRPPEGKFSNENLEWAKAMGYKTVLWSLAYVDWKLDAQPTPEQAFSKLLPRTHGGAIVLLHSTSATNAQILDELLTKWEEMGYTFGSLTELGSAEKPTMACSQCT